MKFQEFRLLPFFIAFFLLFVFSFTFPKYSFAKSGCCSSHNGVDCAAGPQANGNVICNDGWTGSSCSYSGMVMCAGYIPVPATTVAPIVSTSQPTIRPTIRPTQIPTPVSTETPTSLPVIQGTSTEVTSVPTPTSTIKPLTAGETVTSLGVLAAIIGLPIWIIVKIVKKFRKPKLEV